MLSKTKQNVCNKTFTCCWYWFQGSCCAFNFIHCLKQQRPFKTMFDRDLLYKYQKQSYADVLQNRCSYKFRKFHRKALVFESLFNKVAGLKACFPVKFAKFLRATFFTEHLLWLLLKYLLYCIRFSYHPICMYFICIYMFVY